MDETTDDVAGMNDQILELFGHTNGTELIWMMKKLKC